MFLKKFLQWLCSRFARTSPSPSPTPKDEEVSYKYYLLGNTVPVRVAFMSHLKAGAETVDRNTGELVQNATLLSRLEWSDEVDEITQEMFEQLCEEFCSKKRD